MTRAVVKTHRDTVVNNVGSLMLASGHTGWASNRTADHSEISEQDLEEEIKERAPGKGHLLLVWKAVCICKAAPPMKKAKRAQGNTPQK